MAVFGVSMFPTDYAIQPVALARAVEERGLESLFFPEHTHIPTSRRTPWPGGAPLPQEYWHTHDPFVALGAAAAATERLRLGTGICLVPERDPIVLAKQAASLDLISNGRFLFGIGAGWNAEELEHHGVAFKDRWAVTRESVLAMRQIWTQEEAEFHGRFVNFERLWTYPKPVQPGGPPILLGANTKWAFDRVVEYCDGWMPINGRGADLGAGVSALRAAAARAGRPFDALDLSVFGVPAREDEVQRLIGLGFRRLIFGLPPAPAETVLPLLDRYAVLARQFA
jgi:probable F420-dependent oxidoreductase